MRPASPKLFVVDRLFQRDDNKDIRFRDEVSYLPLGSVVLYLPQDASKEIDVGWWKVRILTRGHSTVCLTLGHSTNAVYVNPHVLASIHGEIRAWQRVGWAISRPKWRCHELPRHGRNVRAALGGSAALWQMRALSGSYVKLPNVSSALTHGRCQVASEGNIDA